MGRSYPAYVVRVGKKPGVYVDWNDVTEQITGVPGSSQKGYNSIEEARIVFDQFLREGSVKAVAARFQPSRRLCSGHEEISEDEDEFFTPSPCKRSLKASTVGALSSASRCGANDSISAPLPPRSRQTVPPLTPPPEAERRGAARGRQRESASASRVKVEVPASSPSVKRYAVAEVQTDLSAVHTTLEIVRTPRRTPRNRSPIRVSSESEDEGTQKVYVKTEPEDSSYISTPSSRPGRLMAYMETRSSSPRTSNYDTAPSSAEQQRSSEQRQKGKARQTGKDLGGHIDTRPSSPRTSNYDTAPSSFVRTPASTGNQSAENAPQSARSSTRRSTRVKTESISTSSSPPTELTQNEDEDPNVTPLHERRRAELNDRRRESERSKAEQPHPSDLQQKGKARQMDEDLDGHESVTSTYQSSAVDDSISARIKTVPRRTRTEPDVSSPTPHAPARLGKSFSMPVPTKSTNYSYKVCSACRQPLSKTSSRVDLLSDAPSCSKCHQPFPGSPCVRSSPRLKRVEQNDEEPGAPTRPSSVCSRQSEDIVNTLGLSVARPESSAASVESDVDPRSPLSRASILRASTLGPSSVLRSPPSTPVGGRRSKIIM